MVRHQSGDKKSHQLGGKKSHQLEGKKSHQLGGKNGRVRGFVNSIKSLVALAVFFATVCLAYASFLSSACVDTPNQCLDTQSGFISTLYFSHNAAEYARLKRETVSESKGLEFMVWEQERITLSKTLLELQHQRINLRPLNSDLWLELNFLNENAQETIAERSWALNRSWEIVGWNHEQSAKLIHHCVREFEFYRQLSTPSCVKNLVHLPASWSLDRTAMKAKLSSQRLERARAEALNTYQIEAY